MEDFSIDAGALSTYFRELHQEKKKLENKLEHLRMRKNDIESKLETVSQKNLMLVQKNDNMARTVNVAKLKVQETQVQVDNLQKKNDELQITVSQVKAAIINEEQRREKLKHSYLERFDELASSFRNASHFYSEASLTEERTNWMNSVEQKINIVSNKRELIEVVSNRLDVMKINTRGPMNEEKPAKNVWQIYLENKDVVTSVFETNIDRKKNVVEKLTQEVFIKSNNVQDLEQQLESLINSSNESESKI